MSKANRYWTVKEMATRFGVTPRTVRRWWQSGRTCLKAWHPDHRLGMKGLRFTDESVEDFAKCGNVNPEDLDEAAI